MRQVIYVSPDGVRWKVQCQHCEAQYTTTQSEAIKKARDHVASLPAETLSQIRVQGPDGEFRTEWTYGADPYPPEG